ncbi:MAG: hypothetical protein M1836_005628 [Candelina mexicana]|nr:MAG: hypothetical protein M1836_005628 [Candelina mexicana]
MISPLPLLSTLLFLTSAQAAVHVAGLDAPNIVPGGIPYYHLRDHADITANDLPLTSPQDVIFYLELGLNRCHNVKDLGHMRGQKINPRFGDLKLLRFDNYNEGKDWDYHIRGYSQDGCGEGKDSTGGAIYMGDIQPGTRNVPVPLDRHVLLKDYSRDMAGWQHPLASFKVIPKKCGKGKIEPDCTSPKDEKREWKEKVRGKRMMVTKLEQVTHFRKRDE